MVSTLFSWHCFWSAKGIFFEKISSMQCHSQAFLWDVYFGRHFISQHPHDDKQKLTREGIGKLYPAPKTIQLKLEISRITLKNAWLPLLWKPSSYRTHDLFCSGLKKLSRSFFGKAKSCRFWLFLFWGGFDSKSSRTLFSIHRYFLKKDFVFIVDLAVVTASFIKTFDTFQFYEYCLISTFPQYWSAIISKKSLVTPNFLLDFNSPNYNPLIPHSHYLGKNTSHYWAPSLIKKHLKMTSQSH